MWRTNWPFQKSSTTKITVHTGFANSYRAVRTEVLDAVKEILQGHPDRTIVLTGHSLGGAIANLAAMDIVEGGLRKASQVDLITFGAPKVGGRSFVSAMAAKKFRTLKRYAYAFWSACFSELQPLNDDVDP